MTTLALPIPKRPVHPTGVWNWLTTIDHKKIGVLYGVTAFILFLTGGLEALYMRVQLAQPNQDVVSPEIYNQLFTMHGTTMIFLAIMPMGAAFFNFIIPLQIGARDVAFPRLNAFSYWVFLAGAIMLKASWFLGGAPNAGWFGYAPITGTAFNPGHGIDFWILSLQILGIASLAAAFNFIVTIVNLRAPRHVTDAHASVCVDDISHLVPADPGLPRHHRSADRVDVRPLLPGQLLRARGGR